MRFKGDEPTLASDATESMTGEVRWSVSIAVAVAARAHASELKRATVVINNNEPCAMTSGSLLV